MQTLTLSLQLNKELLSGLKGLKSVYHIWLLIGCHITCSTDYGVDTHSSILLAIRFSNRTLTLVIGLLGVYGNVV